VKAGATRAQETNEERGMERQTPGSPIVKKMQARYGSTLMSKQGNLYTGCGRGLQPFSLGLEIDCNTAAAHGSTRRMQLPNKRLRVSHGGTVSPDLFKQRVWQLSTKVTAVVPVSQDVMAPARIRYRAYSGGGGSLETSHPEIGDKHSW
jgi:hypothetical protein